MGLRKRWYVNGVFDMWLQIIWEHLSNKNFWSHICCELECIVAIFRVLEPWVFWVNNA